MFINDNLNIFKFKIQSLLKNNNKKKQELLSKNFVINIYEKRFGLKLTFKFLDKKKY